ncbi:MAG: phosphonate metabolism protein PhnP [Candidatus Accumulibacter sp.]|jgi:phosphoribosyl 1,2-cyclic phosphate phosphodiesterase|nr:phosphonate metabolism protein PhnP [Accumulibacter sp.]
MPGLRLSFLGTGDAAQTPVHGCGCPVCERARKNAAHRRGPSAALLEIAEPRENNRAPRRWLIDSGLPDLAERFPGGSLDGIFQTHYHADHAEGLLRLRWGLGPTLPVSGPDDPEGFADLYKHHGPLDFSKPFAAFERRPLGETSHITAIPLTHSRPCLGYLIESGPYRLAYLTDTIGLPPESEAYLKLYRLDLLVLDCTFPPQETPPRNHNDLTRALQTIAALRPERTLLTHIGHTFDAWLESAPACKSLPPSVSRAHDGLSVICQET